MKTTMRIIDDLAGHQVAGIVDPFTGGGSSAVAARLMGLPFFGIELDPVLACVSIAKSQSDARHGELLGDLSCSDSVEALLEWWSEESSALSPSDRLVVGCLSLLILQTGVTKAAVLQDLRSSSPPCRAGRTIWGDSFDPASWVAMAPAGGHVVVYTSPPFGFSSPRLESGPGVATAAKRLLSAGGMAATARGVDVFPDFTASSLAVVQHAAKFLSRATIIIEHENADDGTDSRLAVAERLGREFAQQLRDIRVLEAVSVSRRGTLSFIVCELGG